jgi:hypothetical protein
MLGKSKPVVFDPYGGRRRRRRVPRWLLLLAAGAALGAGGLLYLQEQVLPQRLSAQASAELRSAYEQADGERQRLRAELAATTRQRDSAQAEAVALKVELSTRREEVARLHEDVSALVEALPPDPREGAVAVRAARFSVEDGQLAYDVVLSREGARAGKPLTGVMQLVVAGASGRADDTITLDPVAISVGAYQSVRGSAPLPVGFKPRQTTIHVLDRAGGKRLGMRIMNVQ